MNWDEGGGVERGVGIYVWGMRGGSRGKRREGREGFLGEGFFFDNGMKCDEFQYKKFSSMNKLYVFSPTFSSPSSAIHSKSQIHIS